jgi:3-hydroxyisobutyrate dehydrogenase-like beta-hydroxyacid dehydrogenase
MSIGFIGVGTTGTGLARLLAKAGHSVVLVARSISNGSPLCSSNQFMKEPTS